MSIATVLLACAAGASVFAWVAVSESRGKDASDFDLLPAAKISLVVALALVYPTLWLSGALQGADLQSIALAELPDHKANKAVHLSYFFLTFGVASLMGAGWQRIRRKSGEV